MADDVTSTIHCQYVHLIYYERTRHEIYNKLDRNEGDTQIVTLSHQ